MQRFTIQRVPGAAGGEYWAVIDGHTGLIRGRRCHTKGPCENLIAYLKREEARKAREAKRQKKDPSAGTKHIQRWGFTK